MEEEKLKSYLLCVKMEEETIILNKLIIGDEKIRKLGNKKKDKFFYSNVKKGTEHPYLEEGWEIYKELKTQTKLRKEKSYDLQFEEKVWCMFSKIGFNEMNEDRNFKIPISKNKETNPKQVDVFAKEENVALIVECKSSQESSKRSLRKEISEINGIRGEIIRSIKEHYNKEIRVCFVLALKNIILNKPDIELAEANNIKIIDYDKIEYYEAIIQQIGPSAKYQLLSEFFEGQGIKGLNIKVPAIRGKINNQIFYSFLIEPSKLLPISFVAHKLQTKDELDSYQRIISRAKLKSIKKYIQDNGLFPNSIIINFRTSKNNLRFDQLSNQENIVNSKFGYLYLPAKYKSAWIIDGQHRLYGFIGTKEADKHSIPVIAFENLDPSDQAKYFVDINSKQKNVPKNLLEELYSNLFWNSDSESERMLALISKLVNDLGTENNSPLFRKIKSSNKNEGRDVPITPTTLTTILKQLKLLGYVDKSSKKLNPYILYSLKDPVMESSLERSKEILKLYFSFFAEKNSGNWDLGSYEGGYLCTNNGLVALLLLFKEILKHVQSETSYDLINVNEEELMEYIYPYLEPVSNYFNNITSEELKNYKTQFGVAGQRNCAYSMMTKIHEKFPKFEPQGLKRYLQDNDSKYTEEIRKCLPKLQLQINKDVLKTLKEEFGNEINGWWYEGVPINVRKNVSARKEEEKLENYEECFDLIHYSEIIYTNWELFKDKYGIGKKTDGKKKQLEWFVRFNNIRKKISHPERGKVTKAEYEDFKYNKKVLLERLDNY